MLNFWLSDSTHTPINIILQMKITLRYDIKLPVCGLKVATNM